MDKAVAYGRSCGFLTRRRCADSQCARFACDLVKYNDSEFRPIEKASFAYLVTQGRLYLAVGSSTHGRPERRESAL